MPAHAINSHLVSFEGVSASVGGFDISGIVEFRLQAAANAVPEITLLVDIGQDGSAEAVEAVSLGNAGQVFGTCRDMVRTDNGVLSFSVTCRVDGPGGPSTQTLALDGWLLTDVALSPVKREGVCTASLTFRHPLFKAHLGGSVPTLVAKPVAFPHAEGGNPLSVFTEALRAYGAAKRRTSLPAIVPGAAYPAEIREQLLSRLERAVADLESSLVWTHGSLPALGYMGGWESAIARALAESYAGPSGGNSVLQALLGGLVPECSLAIGGDYTKGQLEIGPFEPWADASLAIADSDIVSLDFPQTDPSPISGVRMILAYTESDKEGSYHPGFCQEGSMLYPAETFYVPDSELKALYLYGPIQQFTEPGWLSLASAYANREAARLEADVVQAATGKLRTAVTASRDAEVTFAQPQGGGAAIDYATAALACAKAYFETSLMKDWTFTVGSRLMFSVGGSVICPGRVVKVMADGREVLGGYVAAVEHVVSVPSRSAVTRVMCTHPRFGKRPDAVTSPTNALYT